MINTPLQVKKQRHREFRILIQNHTACRLHSCGVSLTTARHCLPSLPGNDWVTSGVIKGCSSTFMYGSHPLLGLGQGGGGAALPPLLHFTPLASGMFLVLPADHWLCALSTGLSSLPLNCNVGGRSGKHIVRTGKKNKTECFFLLLKVVMVQLVAKPLPSLPCSPPHPSLLPSSRFSPGKKCLHWRARLIIPTRLPGREAEFRGGSIQCLQAPAGFGGYQQADTTSSKGSGQ